MTTKATRPCRYCVADWAGHTGRDGRDPILPTADDCKAVHRDHPAVYALARAFAATMQQRNPTDEQIGWYLDDADNVVDDFLPAPNVWRVRRLPNYKSDGPDGIEIRLRINGVTYVGLEGGKDCPGDLTRLSTFREQQREANAEAGTWT